MLPKGIFSAIRLSMKIGRLTASFPVFWDHKSRTASAPSSKIFYARWLLCVFYVFFNTVFMIVRLIQAACCMNLSYGRLFVNLYNIMNWITGSFCHINTLKHHTELVGFVNHLIQTIQYFDEIQPESNVVKGRSHAKKFSYAIYFYCFMQFFIALRTLDKNPKYLFSLTGIRVVARWKLIPLAVFESYMSYHIASLMLFYVMYYVTYVKSATACLNIVGTQNIGALPKYYRMLQVMNNEFSVCFRYIIVPITFFNLMAINALSNYATVRLYGEVKMPGYLGFPVTILATLFITLDVIPTSYKVVDASVKLFKEVTQVSRPNSFITKFLHSCQPLGVRVGGYFVIKQVTMMTFLAIVVDNAITMLLTF